MNKNCIQYEEKKFNIQQLTRLREDNCYLETRKKESNGPGIYVTRGHRDCTCEAKHTKDLSLQQPTTQYRDGYGWTSNDGCNVDKDSNLRNARNLTNPRLIQQLHERPYLTVPYMGRGEGDVCEESHLRHGEGTMHNRPCNNLAGIYIDRYTPQIPCIRESVQNPKHIVPEDTDVNWIRGGQPSRQIIRNKDYLKKCGFSYNGKYWNKS